jgi:hypothetical protein
LAAECTLSTSDSGIPQPLSAIVIDPFIALAHALMFHHFCTAHREASNRKRQWKD